jgi:hypothetical protein
MPDELRMGETLLFSKEPQPSAAPDKYRPITLLPILVRLLHKMVDNHLRTFIFGTDPDTSAPSLSHCKLFLGQGGFQRRRGASDQAFLLYIIMAAEHSKHPRQGLYGAFLDIYKAFDSLDHGHLLHMFEHNIGLSPEWLEIIRRLLIGNTTKLFGRVIRLTIGSAQGSSLSPLFCLVYIDDLARDLIRFYEEFPEDYPARLHYLALETRVWTMLVLLLFADDILALGLTIPQLQRLLTRIGDWAQRRGLSISPKSFLAVLIGSPLTPAPLPTLTIHGLDLTWLPDDDIFRYMGIPYRVYHPYWRMDGKFPLALDSLRDGLSTVRGLCFASNGTRLIYVPTVLTLLEHLVYSKALHPTAVVDIDYAALDSLVYDTLRTLFQLPKCTPTVLLFWELRLLPARLLAWRRALRGIWRLVNYSPLYPLILRRIVNYKGSGCQIGLHRLYSRGPIRRIIDILNAPIARGVTIGDIVSPGLTDNNGLLPYLSTISYADWRQRVGKAISLAYAAWVRSKLGQLPQSYQAPLMAAMGKISAPTGRRPDYLSLGGDRARAALRFKTPFLRFYHDRHHPIPACQWCTRAAAECGHHLITCPHQPASVHHSLLLSFHAISRETGKSVNRDIVFIQRAFLTVSWKHMSKESVMLVLGSMSHIINEYRKSIVVDGPQQHPISPLRTLAI